MKILITGGNGNISWWVTKLAVEAGNEVWVVKRESKKVRRILPEACKIVFADVNELVPDPNHLFDVVIDFLCYTPDQARKRIDLFKGITDQYIFISSTAVCQRPSADAYRENSRRVFGWSWDYALNKRLAEDVFMEEYSDNGFPVTIVRPGHTYDTQIPVAVGNPDWTTPQRMIDGKPIIVHDTGLTSWTLTHSEDFAKGLMGLVGNQLAIGQAFHITDSIYQSWDWITYAVAKAVGTPIPEIIHISSETIYRDCPYLGNGLLGHKAFNDTYWNGKIKTFVPKWNAKIWVEDGIQRTIQWFDEHPELKVVDRKMDAWMDKMIENEKVKEGGKRK
jgi:nucleoside-diphosphate-sugar epimerase